MQEAKKIIRDSIVSVIKVFDNFYNELTEEERADLYDLKKCSVILSRLNKTTTQEHNCK